MRKLQRHRRQPQQQRKRQQGYVLPITIAILAIVLVGATFVAQRANLSVKLAQQEVARADQQLQVDDLQQKMLFWLSTQPRQDHRLGPVEQNLRFDGTRYVIKDPVAGDIAVSLQDAKGLVGLRLLTKQQFGRLIASFGVSPDEADTLQDVFKDFEDPDNPRRLNGAEADDYRLQNLPPPRNAQVVTLTEVQAMPGWRDYAALWKIDGLLDHSTIGKGEQLNLQTATWRTLVTMAGADVATAKELVARREAGEPLSNELLYSLNAQAGGQGTALDIGGRTSSLVSETVIITLQPSKAAWALRLTVLHTPVSDLAPWRIVTSQVIERNPIENNNNLPILPELDPNVDARYRGRGALPF